MIFNVSKSALTIAICGSPMIANAVILQDYLVANSSYEEAFLDAQFNAGDGPQNEQIDYDLDFNSQYSKTFSTLPRSWNYTLGASAKARQFGITPTQNVVDENGATVLDADGNPEVEELPDHFDNWTVEAEGTIDTYFINSKHPKTFWFGQGRYAHDDSAPDDDVSATIGLGYGRVYNATPLAKVIRIVEELNVEGILTGPIPDSVALEVAEIIDREDEFKSRFGVDQYRRDYYAAIEAALARSGAVRDGKLGALGALTVDEILDQEPISVRRHGWVVRLGAGFQASERSGQADDDPKLLLQWEYAKPYGYKGQFINLVTYEPVFGDETTQAIRNQMSYTHELSDRVDWVNTWAASFSDSQTDTGADRETISHLLTSSYRYHLNNRLDYTVTLSLRQTDITSTPEDPEEPDPSDDPTVIFNMGFKYRLK
ncbi:hypothetical protein AB833_26885 [Chromatiales bacterium (ex Bugula neritina AB1)]|nr:hypothetical protein AB833_26885 [Chromatiales bacterium (ex Bugula neritina AB1)]